MPSRKRRKTNTRTPTSQGVSIELTELPLDILLQILDQLHPFELLCLSRTTKSFRAYLMNSKSRKLWTNAFARINFPECPAHLSEPLLAYIAFEPLCHGCGKAAEVDRIFWAYRGRFCSMCLTSRATLVLPPLLQQDNLQHQLSQNMRYPGSVNILFPVSYVGYFKQDVDEFVSVYNALESQEEKDEVVRQRQTLTAQIVEHSLSCGEWFSEAARALEEKMAAEEHERQEKRRKIRDIRCEMIITHLKQIGWGDEISHFDASLYGAFRKLPLVCQAKSLTPNNWQKIQPKMVEFMEQKKAERLAKRLRDTYTERFRLLSTVVNAFYACHFPERQSLPSIVDLCLIPEVRATLDVDLSSEITEARLRNMLDPMLANLVARWQLDVKSQLMDFAESNLGISRSANLSQLASAVFKCSRCHAGRPFPTILDHECLHAVYEYTPEWNDHLKWTTYEGRVKAMYRRGPWSCNVLERRPWKERVENVIKTCGMDPRTATLDDMDASDARLICKRCRHNSTRTIMSWRTAIDHSFACHNRADFGEELWQRVGDQDANAARRLEEASREASRREHEKEAYWACTHCPRYNRSPAATVRDHIRSDHNVIEPKEVTDYHQILDSPQPVPGCVILVSDKVPWEKLRPREQQWINDGVACFHNFT